MARSMVKVKGNHLKFLVVLKNKGGSDWVPK
jgi:hypothetical protein